MHRIILIVALVLVMQGVFLIHGGPVSTHGVIGHEEWNTTVHPDSMGQEIGKRMECSCNTRCRNYCADLPLDYPCSTQCL
ncbi:unnamed protein product [Adineta ricciae]|uniref:Uncharacterized protein n=1 Tax=Adineta ricciae TaxID=249248 RepID=A0A815H0M9_ADIRI|nr:unnamed protein product [Adineta ricciae]CAF1347758.1 unnamed protein product [Adineta ricciae]